MILVLHRNTPTFGFDQPGCDQTVTAVAIIETDSLDLAYSLTNNRGGSWSKGKTVVYNGNLFHNNPDFDARIKVVGGYVAEEDYGKRSTSVGDRMIDIQNGVLYEVADFGFKKIGKF